MDGAGRADGWLFGSQLVTVCVCVCVCVIGAHISSNLHSPAPLVDMSFTQDALLWLDKQTGEHSTAATHTVPAQAQLAVTRGTSDTRQVTLTLVKHVATRWLEQR